jgi:nitrogen fixation protein FixH
MDDERKTLVVLGGIVAFVGTVIAVALVLNALVG